MGARYYAGEIGRFISQDPVALALGDWEAIEDMADAPAALLLREPQFLNSYSYAVNNPLKYDDPNGEIAPLVAAAVIYSPQILAGAAALSTPLGVALLVDDYGVLTGGESSLVEKVIVFAGPLGDATKGAKIVNNLSPKQIFNSWNKGTFDNKVQSIRYHLKEHGHGRTLQEYTADGQKFYDKYADIGLERTLKNGDPGIKITNKQNNYYGIYDSNGKQVSHGPIDKKKEFSVD